MGGNIVNVPGSRLVFVYCFMVVCGSLGARSVGSACCWVLRGQAPLLERVLLSLAPGASPRPIPVPSCGSCVLVWVFLGGGRWGRWVRWWVLSGVCGLVGVCELDSGCEHLVVMFCGLCQWWRHA
jgi:hypothetical protein